MSKHQKGRRHRTVNRTPRPVTSRRTHADAGRLQSAAPAQAQSTHRQHGEQRRPAQAPAAARPPATVAASATATAPTATAPVTAPPAPGHADAEGPDLDRVFGPARDGGLGRGAAQTWRHLKERGPEGATLQELSEAAGYQEATISKHVTGLAEHSLARQRDDRWYATTTAH